VDKGGVAGVLGFLGILGIFGNGQGMMIGFVELVVLYFYLIMDWGEGFEDLVS
jgi:hypothetical protein